VAASGPAVIRLQLSGVAQVVSGFGAAGRAVGSFNKQVQTYNQQLKEGGKRSFLMNQLLFTMRRYAYAGTLALTGLGTAAAAMGVKFDASMETNQIALEQFLGSTRAAKNELAFLYDLAKTTPFEFTNVTDAARRFLAFGFTLKQTNENLRVIGDTVAAFGGGGEQIERMVTVFGQIRASGRLLGQDLLQLEQQGIPVIDILTQKLAKYGVTRAMLSRPGELQIPSEIGIPALMAGMRERFAGASARQAKTFVGQLSTLHDNVAQVMGGLMANIFAQTSRGILPGLNKMFGQIGQLSRKQGGRLRLDQVLGIAKKNYPQLKSLIDLFGELATITKSLFAIFKDMLPIFLALAYVLDMLLKPVAFMAKGLSANTWWAKILRIAVLELITVYTVVYVWMNKVQIMAFLDRHGFILLRRAWEAAKVTGGLLWRTMRLIWVWMKLMGTAAQASLLRLRRLWLAFTRGTIVLKGFQGAQKMTAMEKSVRRLGIAFRTRLIPAILAARNAMFAFFFENPVGIVIGAILLIIGLLVILYFRWKWFHNLVNRTAKWLWKHWYVAAAILLVFGGVFVALAFIIVKHWKMIWGWIQKVWDLVKAAIRWIEDHWKLLGVVLLAPFTPMVLAILAVIHWWKVLVGWIRNAIHWIGKFAGKITSIHVPGWLKAIGSGIKTAGDWGLAAGTPLGAPLAVATAVSGGGAIPISGASPAVGSIRAGKGQKSQINSTVHTSINIDGKKVAESTSKHRQNKAARR